MWRHKFLSHGALESDSYLAKQTFTCFKPLILNAFYALLSPLVSTNQVSSERLGVILLPPMENAHFNFFTSNYHLSFGTGANDLDLMNPLIDQVHNYL